MPNYAFVFAVCGDASFLNEALGAVHYLQKATKYPIYLVTDSRRNAFALQHSHLIDVPTPPEFTNHQAAIFLKLSLPEVLPTNTTYCYLDTDILPFRPSVDAVFEQFIPPVRFAADHCTMQQFSPYALHCGCLERLEGYRHALEQAKMQLDPLLVDSSLKPLQGSLYQAFKDLKNPRWQRIRMGLLYALRIPKIWLNPQFYVHRPSQTWHTAQGQPVMRAIHYSKIIKKAGLRYQYLSQQVLTPEGENIWINQCNHLQHALAKQHQLSQVPSNWQHWNGGVFLFNQQSIPFFKHWKSETLQAFADPYWKTRDQATLIVTCWKLGLQNHPLLAPEWNCIVDFYKNGVFVNAHTGEVQRFHNDVVLKPAFLHVYHQYGDTNWPVWQAIQQYMNRIF